MRCKGVVYHRIDDLIRDNPRVTELVMNRNTLAKFVQLAGKKTKVVKKQRIYVSPQLRDGKPPREILMRVDQRIEGEDVWIEDGK